MAKLTVYDVILGPIVSEKASKLINQLKKVVLKVHPAANKPMVAEALKKLFDVRVENIRIQVRKGKRRQFRKMTIEGTLEKRAIVTLKDAESFDKLAYAGAAAPTETGQPIAEPSK